MKVFEKIILDKEGCEEVKANASEFIQSGSRVGEDKIGYNLKRRNSLKADIWIEKGTKVYDKVKQAFDSAGYELLLDRIFFELYKYETGHFIARHTDVDVWENSRFGQLCIQISEAEDYEGGDLLFYDELNNPIQVGKEQGNAILFTHEVPHEVKEVISGTRLSLIYTVLKADLKAVYKKSLF